MTNKLGQIKKLRLETGSGVMACRKALEESDGDYQAAKKWLLEEGIASANRRTDRETKEGVIETYTHTDGKIVGLAEILCETDFVARNQEFKKLAHELAMQVAAMAPASVEELLAQPYIRDEKMIVEQLVKTTAAKIGENIVVNRIARFELGNNNKQMTNV